MSKGLTGNGTTFAITALGGGATPPASAVGRVISIGDFKGNIEEIEDDDLASTVKKYIAGDLVDFSQLQIQVVFDPDVHMLLAMSHCGVSYLGTLTFPLPDDMATPANLAGSGFIVESGMDGLENNSRSEGALVWRFDNQDTALAFTAAAAS